MNLKTFCIKQQIEYKEVNISSPIINKFMKLTTHIMIKSYQFQIAVSILSLCGKMVKCIHYCVVV